MAETHSILSRGLQFEAASHLRGTDNMRRVLLWAKASPEEFSTRLLEFDINLVALKHFQPADPDLDRDVIALHNLLGDERLTTLTGLSLIARDAHPDEQRYQTSIQNTFSQIAQHVSTHEWQFPTDITDNPGKVVSGLLIEGYGLYLENYLQKPGTARTFVLAFERVLFTKHPESKLLKDVALWVDEEIGSYPPGFVEIWSRRNDPATQDKLTFTNNFHAYFAYEIALKETPEIIKDRPYFGAIRQHIRKLEKQGKYWSRFKIENPDLFQALIEQVKNRQQNFDPDFHKYIRLLADRKLDEADAFFKEARIEEREAEILARLDPLLSQALDILVSMGADPKELRM